MTKRNPVVVVLGHVDHGKTTLLDAIRKTSVASREAGGITQSIGASVVGDITFIDTPGHAAFSKMRGRGANVADIAILVVACDDGVAPQTKEALQIIKDSKIPFVVAATKSDISGVNPETVRGGLEKEEVLFEGRGGDIPFVAVSAKTGTGLDSLLEVIKLIADVNEISGDPNGELESFVIESGVEKMGPTGSIVVKNGKIKVGDELFVEEVKLKVRGIFNDRKESVKEVLPGFPAKIIGFTTPPPVGAKVSRELTVSGKTEIKSLLPYQAQKVNEGEIAVIIKAENVGSLEALIASLPKKAIVVNSAVGDVTGSDILLARSTGALVFAFECKLPNDIQKLAEVEGVKCKRFEIIYELIQEIELILKKGLVEITGKAQVLALFPYEKKVVAGSKVTFGKMSKGDRISLVRDEKEVGKAKIVSLRKQKSEVQGVIQGEEFGAITEPQLDFQVGDVLLSSR